MSDNTKRKDEQWIPYVGPQDGVGWASGNEVVYDDEPPGEIDTDAVDAFLNQLETDAEREQARQELGLDEPTTEDAQSQTDTDTGVSESVSDIVASVDIENTERMGFSRDPQMEFERLQTSEVRELKQTLTETVADAEAVEKMWDLLNETKVTAEGASASYAEGLAEETFDMEGEIIGEVGEDREWYSDEEQQIMKVWSELSERLLEETFGEDYDLHRGVSEIGGAYFAKSFFADPESDDFEVEETLIANYTPSKRLAKTFSHGNLTITETEPDPICANDMIRGEYMQMGSEEGEVWLPGAEQSAAPENIVVGEVGGLFTDDEQVTLDEIQQPIEELDERGLEAIKPHAEALVKQARAGEIDVSEAVAKRLQTFFKRYDEVNDGFLDMFTSPIDVDVDRITNMQKDEQEIDLTDDKGWLERGRMIDGRTEPDTETEEVARNIEQKGNWIPYQGPQGGEGWRNTETGDIEYQEEPPGGLDTDVLSEEQVAEIQSEIHNDDDEMDTEAVVSELSDVSAGWSDDELDKAIELVTEDAVSPETAAEALCTRMESEIWGFDAESYTDDGKEVSGNLLTSVSGTVDELGVDVGLHASYNGLGIEGIESEYEERLESREQIDFAPLAESTLASALDTWIGQMFGDDAAPLFQVAAEETGNETIPENEEAESELLEHPVTETEEIAIREKMEQTQEILREAFGETITVFRGMSTKANPTSADATSASVKLNEASRNGDTIEHEHRPIESWTTSSNYASTYSNGFFGEGEGTLLKKEVPVERILLASHTSGLANGETEIVVMHDEEEMYEPDQVIPDSELDNQKLIEETLDAIDTADVTVEKAETTMSKDDIVEIEAESVNPKWLHQDPPENSMQDSDDEDDEDPMTRSYTHPDMVTVGTVQKVADKYLDGTGLSESDFVPNKDMYETAMDAIEFVDEYGMPRPENQQEGITRAHQIRRAYENDSPIEFDYWNEIYNYHKRKHAQDAHICDESSIAESDKESINQNEHDVCMFDPGWYSCQTWGGEAGYDQAERIVTAVEDADVEKQGGEIDIPGYPEIPPEDDVHPKMIELLQALEEEVDWENSDKPLLYHILGSGTPPYKMSKEDANYDTEPHGNARCGNCEFYYEGVDGSGVCSQVKGNIMPSHWCRLWVEAELDVEDLPAENPESPDNKSVSISKGVGDAQLPDTYEDATMWALAGVVRGLDSIPFGKRERVVKRFERQVESGKKLGVALSTVLQDELDWSETKANRETVNALTNDRVTKIDELNGE